MPANINLQRLLDRFVRYVKVDTTADPAAKMYPSSPGQLELGRLLLAELRELGLADAVQSPQGIVTATLPGTVKHSAPTIAFCSHLDTSPETSGRNVQPQVWRNYDGNDIKLPSNGRVIRVADSPELADLRGKTIVTTDGATLLGADDKAGLATIMELIAWLVENPQCQHGPIRICFTCDEEIGHGVDHVDLKQLGAAVCYTLDGGGTNEIDVETFSADLATVTARGVNIHPSIGRGRMVNAVRALARFIDALPRATLAPESTDGRAGFMHPYHISGGVAEAQVQILLRDFRTAALAEQAEMLRAVARQVMADFPGLSIDVSVTEQYRNMADGLAREPRAVALAEEAHRRLGRVPRQTIVRGGTDGSRLTELGLPTPNLSCGEHNMHAPLEWTCLEEMGAAVEVLIELCQVWGEQRA